MTVNRDTARRNTARARAAAFLLIGAGVAVAIVPLPMLRPAASAAAIELSPAAPDTTPKPDSAPPPIDLQGVNGIIWALSPPATEEPKPPTPDVATAGGTTPSPAPAASLPGEWRYVGSIAGPRGMHAILEREGRQQLVKAGDELDRTRIVAVEAGSVTINKGSGDEEIKLSPRTSRWTAASAASAALPAPPRTPPNRAGVPVNRPPVPPQRNLYSEMSDEERERYEAEKLEKYREAGETMGVDPTGGGKS